MVRIAAALGLMGAMPALAQGGPPAPSAIHVQAVPAEQIAPLETRVLFPPPDMEGWDAVESRSDAGCLQPIGVERPEGGTSAGTALTLRVAVVGESGSGLEPGESCAGTVDLEFSASDVSERVSIVVSFFRPDFPPYLDTDLVTTYSLDRISLAPLADGIGHLLELQLRNDGQTDVVFLGLAHLDVVRDLLTEAYVLPGDDLVGSLEGLEPLDGETSLPVPPGDSVRIGIVLGNELMSAQRTVAALQPAILVESGGERYSVRFGLIVTATGLELP